MKLFQKIKKLIKRKSVAKEPKPGGGTVSQPSVQAAAASTSKTKCPKCIKQAAKVRALKIKLYNLISFTHEHDEVMRLNKALKSAIKTTKAEQQRQNELNERLREEHHAYVSQFESGFLKQQAELQPTLNSIFLHRRPNVQYTQTSPQSLITSTESSSTLSNEFSEPAFVQTAEDDESNSEAEFHPLTFVDWIPTDPYHINGEPSGVPIHPLPHSFYIGNSAARMN